MNSRKITADDIRFLLDMLPRLEKEELEARQSLIERRNDFFASDCLPVTWCGLYELSFLYHAICAVTALGQESELKSIAQAPNQIKAMATFVNNVDKDESEFSPSEKEELRPKLAHILGLVTSLLRSLQCLMAYGCYLNELVAVARSGGRRGDQAIFKAIRIDPTIVGAPTVLARISQATLEDDKGFLKSMKKAINGGLAKQAQANADRIRLVLQVLQESGAGSLSNDALHKLFVEELKLYAAPAKSDIGDAAKGIRAINDRMKKAKATT
jgi:hypothetical protein